MRLRGDRRLAEQLSVRLVPNHVAGHLVEDELAHEHLPLVAWWRDPDLDLLRFGLIEPGDLPYVSGEGPA